MSTLVDIASWANALAQAKHRQGQRHPIICKANFNGREVIKVLSQEEYNQYSWWSFARPRKLTLYEITSITFSLLLSSQMCSDIKRSIRFGYVQDPRVLLNIETSLKSALESLKHSKSMIPDLQSMYEHSKQKHSDQKTNRVWGAVYCIRSWFYDPKTKIDEVVQKNKIAPVKFLESVLEELKSRVEINIDDFAEQIHEKVFPELTVEEIRKSEASPIKPDPTEKYRVVRSWINKYHPDQFPDSEVAKRVSDYWVAKYGNSNYQLHYQAALDARGRILALLSVWKTIDRYVEELVNNANPAPVPDPAAGVGI